MMYYKLKCTKRIKIVTLSAGKQYFVFLVTVK